MSKSNHLSGGKQNETESSPDSTAENEQTENEWGFESGRRGMSKETKIGLLLILMLLGAFSFVMYKKLHKNDAVLTDIKQAVGMETAENQEEAAQKEENSAPAENATAQAAPDADASGDPEQEFDVPQSEPRPQQQAFDPNSGDAQSRRERDSSSNSARQSSNRDARSHSNHDPFFPGDGADQVAGGEQSDFGDDSRKGAQRDDPFASGSQQQDALAEQTNSFQQRRREFSQYLAQETENARAGDAQGFETSSEQQDFAQNRRSSGRLEESLDSGRRLEQPSGAAKDRRVDAGQQLSGGIDSDPDFDGPRQATDREAFLGENGDQGDHQDYHRTSETSQAPAGTTSGAFRRGTSLVDAHRQNADSGFSRANAQHMQTGQNPDIGRDENPIQQSFSPETVDGSLLESGDSGSGRSGEDASFDSFSQAQAQSQAVDEFSQQSTNRTHDLFSQGETVSQGDAARDPKARIHLVQRGDSYWSISKKQYGTARYFSALARYNQGRIPNPKRMRAGMKVLVPSRETLEARYPDLFPGSRRSGTGETGETAVENGQPGFFRSRLGEPMYRIGKKDTLTEIARAHLGRSSRWVQIFEMNRTRLKNPNDLTIGTVLRLPGDASQVNLVPTSSGIR